MTKVGVIGLGDMGSGLAKNLIKAGFDVAGLDLDFPTPKTPDLVIKNFKSKDDLLSYATIIKNQILGIFNLGRCSMAQNDLTNNLE